MLAAFATFIREHHQINMASEQIRHVLLRITSRINSRIRLASVCEYANVEKTIIPPVDESFPERERPSVMKSRRGRMTRL